jgi:formylglycine-generating enzyme required for sulfatase activity
MLPVDSVSWEDAKEFCLKLSKKTGREYRMPTEAEWEFACRAGTTTDFAGDLDAMGWYHHTARGKTHRVGRKEPNAYTIYDMHGNVWEWCEDVWHSDYNGAPVDGSAWLAGGKQSSHAVRGGSWNSHPFSCRSANRLMMLSGVRYYDLGFRLACDS